MKLDIPNDKLVVHRFTHMLHIHMYTYNIGHIHTSASTHKGRIRHKFAETKITSHNFPPGRGTPSCTGRDSMLRTDNTQYDITSHYNLFFPSTSISLWSWQVLVTNLAFGKQLNFILYLCKTKHIKRLHIVNSCQREDMCSKLYLLCKAVHKLFFGWSDVHCRFASCVFT
jgi:hypothetical protein